MQGTISILFGCHSTIHSILVTISWIKLYRRFPKPWELICIFLHDIGHIGKQYLDDYEQKKEHWILGAKMSRFLFGKRGYNLVAGHCTHNGIRKSLLYKPDKYSWYIAPTWWLITNNIFEPKLRAGLPTMIATRSFQERVKKNIETDAYKSTHGFHLERQKSRLINKRRKNNGKSIKIKKARKESIKKKDERKENEG